MALNVTPKAASAASATPSRVVTRTEVSMGRQTTSSARAEALKTRLSAQPPAQPVAPRPARSSARAEEFSKLNKFNTPAPVKAKPVVSRPAPTNLEEIEPPPSGLTTAPEAMPSSPKAIPTDNSVESAPEPTEATSEVPASPQLDLLARKERQVRKAQQELKAAQEAWKREQASYLSRETLLSDPLKVLAEAGITADKLVELQINQAAPKDPNQALQEEVAALKAQINELVDPENGTLAKRDQQAYNQALAQIEADAKLLVESNPAYGTIKSEGKASEVKDLIVAVFNEEGTILDVEEACQLVEEKLVQNLLKDYERISKYDKIKAKIGKPAETLAEEVPVQQPTQKPKQTTLTNAGSQSRPLSARDRAVLLVQERLNARNK
jgi:hypothetical protein